MENTLKEHGFKFARPKYGTEMGNDTADIVPKDADSLPIYSRDASIYNGTLDQIDSFIRGVEWAREYDSMLKVSDRKRRERKEQDVRNRQLVQQLKNEKVGRIP